MTQYQFPVVDPAADTGTTLSQYLNQWVPAVVSNHAGAARPSYAVPGTIYYSTTSLRPIMWSGSQEFPLALQSDLGGITTGFMPISGGTFTGPIVAPSLGVTGNLAVDGATTVGSLTSVGAVRGTQLVLDPSTNSIVASAPNGQVTICGSTAFGTLASLILNGGARGNYLAEIYNGNDRAFTVQGDGTVTIDGGGTAYKAGGGAWLTISDERTKQDITDYTSGLAEILQLRPRVYRYKPEVGFGDKTMIGLVAQEAQPPMPETVFEGANGLLNFDSGPILYALINAVKELQQQINELKSRKESGL